MWQYIEIRKAFQKGSKTLYADVPCGMNTLRFWQKFHRQIMERQAVEVGRSKICSKFLYQTRAGHAIARAHHACCPPRTIRDWIKECIQCSPYRMCMCSRNCGWLMIGWLKNSCRIAGSNPLFYKSGAKTAKRLHRRECHPTQFRQTSPRRIIVRSLFGSELNQMRLALFLAELLRGIPILAIKFGMFISECGVLI